MVDHLGDDEVEKLFGEGRVEMSILGEAAQSVDLHEFTRRVGGRQSVGSLEPPDLLGEFEPLGQQMNERGVDVVDALSNAVQLQGRSRVGVGG